MKPRYGGASIFLSPRIGKSSPAFGNSPKLRRHPRAAADSLHSGH
ncbi:hypothetical protein LG3211_0495 [Lysobacter gummosus]|nr:hypothetical protein LG3211_0495 [Lysobacter gummosus]